MKHTAITHLVLAAFLGLAASLAGCGGGGKKDATMPAVTPPVDTAQEEAAIRKLVVDIYGAKVNAQDAAGYANELYAEEVLWAPPDAPDRNDRAGVQAGIQTLFDKFTFDVKPEATEIKVMGDFAYAIGQVDLKLTPKAGGDVVPARFRIFWLLQKGKDGWRINRQIWNKKPLT